MKRFGCQEVVLPIISILFLGSSQVATYPGKPVVRPSKIDLATVQQLHYRSELLRVVLRRPEKPHYIDVES
jgi:hypothetical protein